MSDLPTSEDLQSAWDDLRAIHAAHLEQHGVKIPGAEQYNEVAKSIWLAVLHYYSGESVHKDTISDVCQRDLPRLGRDQQVRHLKRDGWTLTGTRGYHQLHPYQHSPEWLTDQARRAGRLNAKTFDDLKMVYDDRCATCGAKEGEPNRRYGEDKVVLQQGHMDPAKPSNDLNNIIPQCQFCNRAYLRDFTFDEKGRVRAVADAGPVERASSEVKKKIFAWLKQFFSNQK